MVWMSLFFWDIGQYAYCNLFRDCDIINFEVSLTFLIKLFSYLNKTSRQRFKTKSWKQKEFLGWNKKHFSSLLKDFQLPKNVSDLRVCFWGNSFQTNNKSHLFSQVTLGKENEAPKNCSFKIPSNLSNGCKEQIRNRV